MKLEDIKIYLVRNSNGHYYRRIGYGGYGSCWTSGLAKASVWTKLSTARGRVTYFANHYPDFPTPTIIEICAGQINELDQAERVQQIQDKEVKSKAKREIRTKEARLDHARQELEKAQQELARLQGKS